MLKCEELEMCLTMYMLFILNRADCIININYECRAGFVYNITYMEHIMTYESDIIKLVYLGGIPTILFKLVIYFIIILFNFVG